jgi:ATP-dependent DNA helicase RecQ
VFGIGRELNEKQWRGVLRQWWRWGICAPTARPFGALKLTESCARRFEGRDRGLAARAGGKHTQSRSEEASRAAASWLRIRLATVQAIRRCMRR